MRVLTVPVHSAINQSVSVSEDRRGGRARGFMKSLSLNKQLDPVELGFTYLNSGKAGEIIIDIWRCKWVIVGCVLCTAPCKLTELE